MSLSKISDKIVFNILKNRGLIRELHVYNWLIGVGNNGGENSTQHRGVGKKLLMYAEWITWLVHGLNGVAVITGEGVRNYYHKRGYYSLDTFAVKDFQYLRKHIIIITSIICIQMLIVIMSIF